MKNKLIDVVITWVNGNDPLHLEKLYTQLPENKSRPPGAKKTRFGNVNEIFYCLFSIFTFAPFVNKIYIITDDQHPEIEDLFKSWFSGRRKDVVIIDHKDIFEEHEEYLPTFNSRTIESMLWRIKELSPRFVYMNDDMFLIRPLSPEDWFIGKTPVLRGKKTFAPFFHVLWQKIQLLINPQKQIRPSFHMGQYNAAKLVGFYFTYFVFSHTPHPIIKEIAATFNEFKFQRIHQQLIYKFRHYSQFNFLSYCYHLTVKKKEYLKKSFDLSYLQPVNRKKSYIDKKIALSEKKENIKFMCVQSLDLCSNEDQEKVLNWIHLRCLNQLKK